MKIAPKVSATLLAALLCVSSVSGWAAEAPFEEGVHYERLPVPVATRAEDAIEVLEVFSYACIHCRNFDPFVEAWRETLPEDVAFRRVPAPFFRGEPLARAYYTAEVLGVLDRVHEPIFRAIHEHRANLRDPELLAALFEAAAEVPAEDFATAFDSFSVRSRVAQGRAQIDVLPSSNVPTMVVAGRYWLNGELAGSNAEMLPVVDYLVGLERRRRGTAPAAAADDAAASAD